MRIEVVSHIAEANHSLSDDLLILWCGVADLLVVCKSIHFHEYLLSELFHRVRSGQLVQEVVAVVDGGLQPDSNLNFSDDLLTVVNIKMYKLKGFSKLVLDSDHTDFVVGNNLFETFDELWWCLNNDSCSCQVTNFKWTSIFNDFLCNSLHVTFGISGYFKACAFENVSNRDQERNVVLHCVLDQEECLIKGVTFELLLECLG